MKLEKDLYAYLWNHAYDNNCNTYVVTGKVVLLIDPGHLEFVSALVSQMEAEGLSPDSIHVVVATHSHPDHLEGIGAFVNPQVKLALAEEEERYLRESGQTLFEAMRRPLPEFHVDFYLKEGKLNLGEKSFDIIQTPGHSPGSFSIYWPERKALFTGDVVFDRGIGRTDFPEGDSKALMKSIEKLAGLETEILLPGHGEIIRGRDAVVENFDAIRRSFQTYL